MVISVTQPLRRSGYSCRDSGFYKHVYGCIRSVYSPSSDKGGIKPNLRVATLLEGRNPKTYTITRRATIENAIAHLVDNRSSASLVLDENGTVIGLFTARDLLCFINQGIQGRYRNVLTSRIEEAMTPGEKVVYCSPADKLSRCREIMYQLRIRHVPVIHERKVVGIVMSKDVTDSAFTVHGTGGKKSFTSTVMGLKGLPTGTCVQKLDADKEVRPVLGVEGGVFALPHPFKLNETVAATRRQFGAGDLTEDIDLCEDYNFLVEVESPSHTKQLYACVADGVGSWRQHGIDPRLYPRRLVENAKLAVELGSRVRCEAKSLFGRGDVETESSVHPFDVVMEAWHTTTAQKVSGSSTICVATVDTIRNQLLYSNIGDCGLMVLRHIDSEVAGYMRDRFIPRHMRHHDMRIAYLSHQQLRSFNLPFQLGYIDQEADISSLFESPKAADTASIPVLPGDVVILATDGLFDNVDLMEIVTLTEQWERKWFPVSTKFPFVGEAIKYSQALSSGSSPCSFLAETLVRTAREFSLDSNKDSPFAVLAKDNNIMWGGGMPDDTTVVVLRVLQQVATAS